MKSRSLQCVMKGVFPWILIAVAPVVCIAQESDAESKLIAQDVVCRGNTSTSCDFIRSYLYLRVGQPINEEEIKNARLRLSSRQNFTSVDIHLEKGSERGQAVVVIEVSEADPVVKESLLATSYRLESLSQIVEGRISHNNLFGAGKSVDFVVDGIIPLNEPTTKGIFSRFQFVDPNLFGSSKFFLISGMSYIDSFIEYTNGDYYKVHQLGIDVSIGRRIFDFSYLTVGYQYRPIADSNSQNWTRWGSQDTNVDTNKNAFYIAYGWNSEDDPYFPTQGSRLYYRAGMSEGTSRQDYETLLYRKTWETSGNSLWAIQLGGTPATENRMAFGGTQLISFSYARPISKSNDFGGIKEGRWYVEPRMGSYGTAPDKASLWELGITAGIRLDVKSIGIVDLYIIGSTTATRK